MIAILLRLGIIILALFGAFYLAKLQTKFWTNYIDSLNDESGYEEFWYRESEEFRNEIDKRHD